MIKGVLSARLRKAFGWRGFLQEVALRDLVVPVADSLIVASSGSGASNWESETAILRPCHRMRTNMSLAQVSSEARRRTSTVSPFRMGEVGSASIQRAWNGKRILFSR